MSRAPIRGLYGCIQIVGEIRLREVIPYKEKWIIYLIICNLDMQMN